ncbi:hypothetical protein QJS10_CPB12g01689 [Acorus calamus]|uniref:Uncharacterized protein n=1 Tax=Acorus calamus TaxID=4465 RepID=A0AAV9DNA9_ACOCL|nr:hypothetical protein QJS10_CPB12g01689 [Acorus calamus]
MRKTMLGSAFQVQATEKNLHTKKNKRRRPSSSRSSTPDDENPSSSAFDVPDHHLLFNLHYSLAGRGEQSRIRVGKPQLTGRKDESLVGDDLTLDPVKQSFSLALKGLIFSFRTPIFSQPKFSIPRFCFPFRMPEPTVQI